MPKITIHRKSEFANSLRSISIYIDGSFKAEISNGETINIDIEKGNHTLIAKIDWASSNEIRFEIDDNNLTFNLKGTNPFLALYYITFGRKKYLKLERV